MTQQSTTEDFRRALLDGPNCLRELQAKIIAQRDSVQERKNLHATLDPDFEQRKKRILEVKKRLESLKFAIGSLKKDNKDRTKHIANFKVFVVEREDSIKNIENIDKTISENATKKISLVERKYLALT